MKEFVLISKGPKGQFVTDHDTLDLCQLAARLELAGGQICEVFVKHSQLIIGEVTVMKTQNQIKAEHDAELAAEAIAEKEPQISALP